ncbi:MAG: hypothetical protein M3Y20_04805, partial [Actinomycetota bacterium]|nr:hypothetical protein [Actinomycetota bacterium]
MQRFWRLLVAAVLALGAGVALAAPASAAVAIVLTPTPAPAQIGGMLNVAGTGCPASSPVFVKIASTVHPAANTSASGAANGAGEFSVDVALLSSTATPFTPGQQLAAAAYCSATNDPLAPHKIEFFTPALLAAPVVTLAVADTQVWDRSEVLHVTVDPAADGLLTVLVDGELLETENYYWLGSAQYTL